jgi:hypothetical protein
MIVKFKGFKSAPHRDHIVIMSASKHVAVNVNEEVEVSAEDGHRLLSTGEFVEVKSEDEKPKGGKGGIVQQPPAAVNRAILDGEVK